VAEEQQAIEEREKAAQTVAAQVQELEDRLREKEGRARGLRDHIRALDGKLAALSRQEGELRGSLRERRVEMEEENEAALRLEAMLHERRARAADQRASRMTEAGEGAEGQ